MKFKLDENFGTRTQQLFLAAGHDVSTVGSQELRGCPDEPGRIRVHQTEAELNLPE